MFAFLKNHPFAVEAFFESTTVLTFALPKAEAEPLIPECLTLDLFDDKWAFIAIAMVQTKNLRPKGFPKMLGNDFFLIGYRVFVRYTNQAGKKLRGLYILKSETDKRKMEFFGNMFTHYDYSTTDILRTERGGQVEVKSTRSRFRFVTQMGDEAISLPRHSPFLDWKEARRFAGPLPFTFTYNEKTKEVLIIQGVRKDWKPIPVKVRDYDISFFKERNIAEPVLANAFVINNIPYHWEKGKIEKWKS